MAVTSRDFDRLTYPNPGPALNDERSALRNIVGFDSEAYTTGEPFMFCTSHGDVLVPEEIPHRLFTVKYLAANFMLYNIRYDSGAILYHLPIQNLEELWRTGKTTAEIPDVNGVVSKFRYKYIPHKLLRIYRGKQSISFWDIAQFYRASLDRAAQTYLNESKRDIATKRFKPEYVKRYWKAISKYCIQDAMLTARLGEYFINKLVQFGITPATIYSSASISFKHFSNNSRIVTSWRLWNENPDVLKFACDAYEGGKFEVTTRGRFTGYEYDITSAYPYEIANLVDISNATCVRSREYQGPAVYGFLRCFIDNHEGRHIPCGVMVNNVRVYPAGRLYLTITKNEYDYLRKIGVEVTILDGVWLFVRRRTYPYRHVIDELYDIKAKFKGKDKMLYSVSKVAMNGFYGKCVQAIDTHDGKILVGAGWNPIYGAVITANTRIKVTDMQNRLGDDCLAVHTDSIMVKNPVDCTAISRNRTTGYLYGKGALGNFEFVTEGSGIIVACGMYQIGEENAFKGFRPKPGDTWEKILSRHVNRKKIRYGVRHVESWVESMAKGHGKTKINVFEKAQKDIDLNCDTKRVWLNRVRARDLLEKSESSTPKIMVHSGPPEFWGVKNLA